MPARTSASPAYLPGGWAAPAVNGDEEPPTNSIAVMTKVAAVREVPPGTGRVVQIRGRAIALFNVDGVFYALDNACTHRGGPLGAGRLDGTIVTCPWHANRFDVTTGQVVVGVQAVTAYAVEVRGDDVLVELPEVVPLPKVKQVYSSG